MTHKSMTDGNYGKFGPLIGVIYINNTHCHFQIYSTINAEMLTFHELKLRQIINNAGWLEYDPMEVLKFTLECIEHAYKSLILLQISPYDIVAIGICNQRGTTVLWNKTTGCTLHNAIGWTDSRTSSILRGLLSGVNNNVNYLRYKTGMPMSSCFSALKIKWLREHVPAVEKAIENQTCLFGTLDTWLIWNLTGGIHSGVHATDVTNAAYTSLMNIHTLKWDGRLCKFYRIPNHILPCIRSNSEVYGYIKGGSLNGLPITGCIGDQPAMLLGLLSTKAGQNVCSIDDSCFVLLNTGKELIESSNGLLTTVGYKLGPQESVHFALEGAIANAGATITWLRDSMGINTVIDTNESNVVDVLTTYLGETSVMTSSCSSSLLNIEFGLAAKHSDVLFVPAFDGLYAPYWRYDARGILMGLTSHTSADNVTQSAFEATGFQIYEVLQAFRRDTSNWKRSKISDRVIFGGEYTEDSVFVQFVADIVGCQLKRPQTASPSGLGAMIAAGITMKVVSLVQAELMFTPPGDVFSPMTTPHRREILYKRWAYAVRKCLSWNNFATYESDLALFADRERDPYLNIRRSIPGSLFITGTFVLLIVARMLQPKT